MNYNTFYNKIETDENLMETIQHGNNDYPFRFYYDNLALFDFYCVEWHWHTEFEFVLIESGTVDFSVGEKQFSLPEGYGIFINSKILHRYISEDCAITPNFVFAPTFIAPQTSLIYQKYVLPIQFSTLDFQTFSPNTPWQAEVLAIMKELITIQEADTDVELKTSFFIQKLWHLIYSNLDEKQLKQKATSSTSSQVRLQLMMQYIHQDFQKELSLDEIAQHAMISKRTALNLFQKYLHTTPIRYLICYRLQEAAKLLATTEKKISTISKNTGFESVDYFCKTFKKYYQMTPTQYRTKKPQD